MVKTDYYELLGVETKATAEEIKKQYRKKAIQYHPDKNKGDENAKAIFQEINEAYQVLSDPNERSWYDNHKKQVLEDKQREDFSKDDIDTLMYGCNIWKFFKPSCYKDYEDGEKGFYNVYRELFEKIKYDEEQAFYDNEENEEGDFKRPPGFGDAATNSDKIEEFYEFWSGCVTNKSMMWSDLYRLQEAENRYVRRLMEKDNKKERRKYKAEYSKTLKKLVDHLKKIDPRYKDYLEWLKEETKRREAKKDEELNRRKSQKQRNMDQARENERLRFEELDREKKERDMLDNKQNFDDFQPSVDVQAEFVCEPCNKDFKSEAQFKNHEKSRSHIHRIKQIYAEVLLENENANGEIREVPVMPELKKPKKPCFKKKKAKKAADNSDEKEEDEDKDLDEDDKEEESKEKENEPPKKEKSQKKMEYMQRKKERESKKDFESPESDDNQVGFGAFANGINKKTDLPHNHNVNKRTGKKNLNAAGKKDSLWSSDEDTKKGKKGKKGKKTVKIQEPVKPAAKKPWEMTDDSEEPVKEEPKEEEPKIEEPKEEEPKEEEPKEEVPKKEEPKEDPKDSDDGWMDSLGKAKVKKMKKKAKQEVESLSCSSCKATFDSKNKLFKHLKDTGHAAPKH